MCMHIIQIMLNTSTSSNICPIFVMTTSFSLSPHLVLWDSLTAAPMLAWTLLWAEPKVTGLVHATSYPLQTLHFSSSIKYGLSISLPQAVFWLCGLYVWNQSEHCPLKLILKGRQEAKHCGLSQSHKGTVEARVKEGAMGYIFGRNVQEVPSKGTVRGKT